MNTNKKGFTLIELLIVVVIIGILAAIAIPKFANTKDKAYVAAMKSDLRNLATYEEQYAADNNGAYFAGTATMATPLQGFTPSQNVTITLRSSPARPRPGARRRPTRSLRRPATTRLARSSAPDWVDRFKEKRGRRKTPPFFLARRPGRGRVRRAPGTPRHPGGSICSVGATGFEPATSCSRSRRATGLRYAPNTT